MNIDVSLDGTIRWVGLQVSKCWFRGNYTWPIRITILQMPTATFTYRGRKCHVEIVSEFHLRTKPIMLKNIRLRLKGKIDIQQAMSFYLRKDYEELKTDCRREEEFIYDNFEEGMEGQLIVRADDDNCLSRWFPIKLVNRKDDLLPLDSIKPKVIKL